MGLVMNFELRFGVYYDDVDDLIVFGCFVLVCLFGFWFGLMS